MKKYLIQSIEHEFGGILKMWWKPNSMGYTPLVDEAGRYSEKEAYDICSRANAGGVMNEVSWLETEVLLGKAGQLRQVIINKDEDK